MAKEKTNIHQKREQIDMRQVPVSDESLSLNARIGVSSNYMNLIRLSHDEVTLDFIKVTASEKKVHKDLVSRVTLSLANAKALRDLLNEQIKD